MTKFLTLLIAVATLLSCDDPSLDRIDPVEIIEPTIYLSQLASITTQDDMGIIIQRIVFVYDNNDRIYRIEYTGNLTQTYDLNYGRNNKLVDYTISGSSTSQQFGLEYLDESITVSETSPATSISYTLDIDVQNRINRIRSYDLGTLLSDKRFTYNENSNVTRKNIVDNSGILSGFEEISYGFLDNPFKDMNDVVRTIFFEEFVSNSRFAPLELTVVDRTAGVDTVLSTTVFEYSGTDSMINRNIETTTAGGTENRLQIFTFR
ncbi:MAG: hypothetical protein WBA16_11025 [Nonlabens sp.]